MDNLANKEDIIPRLVDMPEHLAVTTTPKLIDFTDIDMYPSKYKIVDGIVHIRSIILENIIRQYEALLNKKTTVMIGDHIKVDFKFGHLENGVWHDYFVKGTYRVKQMIPQPHNEVLILVVKV